MPEGSGGQKTFFETAAAEGKAYVHKDFDLISAGDFIQRTGHVLIATGRVIKDDKGKVLEFETLEARGVDYGSVRAWHKPGEKDFTIGHPFRTTDEGVPITVKITIFNRTFTIPILSTPPSKDGKTRLKDNIQQTQVKAEDKDKPPG